MRTLAVVASSNHSNLYFRVINNNNNECDVRDCIDFDYEI